MTMCSSHSESQRDLRHERTACFGENEDVPAQYCRRDGEVQVKYHTPNLPQPRDSIPVYLEQGDT